MLMHGVTRPRADFLYWKLLVCEQESVQEVAGGRPRQLMTARPRW